MDAKVLARLSATDPLDETSLRATLERMNVPLGTGERPFVDAAELRRRYGFPLPADLDALWSMADEHMIERAALDGFRYVRLAPGGWEPPATAEHYPYVSATFERFEWNTFSNMQLLERLVGLAPLGWDRGDDRLEVATCHPDAPVFWLDHETADLLAAGCVAHSLDRFLRATCGVEAELTEQEIALARDGSHWARSTDKHAYLPALGRLRTWPPFLWARHAWIVAELAFGSAREQLVRPEVDAYDFVVEEPLLDTSEPLALYWLLRSLLLDDAATLARAVEATSSHASPFVRALARALREAPAHGESLLSKARGRAHAYRDRFVPSRGAAFAPDTF